MFGRKQKSSRTPGNRESECEGERSPDELKQKANRYFLTRKLNKAEDALNRILDDNENDTFALDKMGVIHAKRGDYDKAEQFFRKALKTDERYTSAFNNLGNIFLERGETGKAIKCYEYALSIDERFVDAYHNLAIAYRREGKIDKYVATLKRSEQLQIGFLSGKQGGGIWEIVGLKKKRRSI